MARDRDETCVSDQPIHDIIRALPKVELHRHLEGAVRLSTLHEIAHEHDLTLPGDMLANLRAHVQIAPDDPRSWQHFLSKFAVLRHFFRSLDIIRRVTYEVVADAAADNIKYLELRFTPQALNNILGCTFEEIISWVCDAAAVAARDHDMQVGLIVSLNRHESIELGEQVLQAAMNCRLLGIVGLDLAGKEPLVSSRPFQNLFERARADGLGVTVHAGEWAGALSVRDALDYLGAERIGHGVRAIEDPAVVARLVERGTALEVCPTSNIHSGVYADWQAHPLARLYQQQVRTTINTDDPLVCDVTLTDELTAAVTRTPLTLADVKQQIITAAGAAFLPAAERAALVARFEDWLKD